MEQYGLLSDKPVDRYDSGRLDELMDEVLSVSGTVSENGGYRSDWRYGGGDGAVLEGPQLRLCLLRFGPPELAGI